ncbi:SRPBCC family protein [Rhodospirillaceae bacterium SYSU D60014]|uniref:SRPBCC family protein n=1 Tax=Virgifigura deserti TaxID=2268457 RepID=UPI000E667120
MSTFEARIISISIDRDWRAVYDFASVPENLPRWASGLGSALEKANGEWTAEGPEGPIRIRFAERNDFGVLDHYVIPEPGVEIYIPLRVIANGTGSEVIFTLFRVPGMSGERFAADAEWVARDLAALKALLEA